MRNATLRLFCDTLYSCSWCESLIFFFYISLLFFFFLVFVLQSAYHDGRETTRMQLLAGCPALQSVNPRVVDQLLEVWNRVCRRIFSHYRLAARGYFTFLKLAGGVSSYWQGAQPCNLLTLE